MVRKKWFLAGAFLVGILGFLVAAPSSHATLVVDDTVYFTNGTGSGGGGEFGVWNTTGGANDFEFNTFCMEKNEYMNFGQEYTVYDLSDSVNGGGINTGPSDWDPMSEQTAWLFNQFWYGASGGSTFTYDGTEEAANDLQNAIWFFEQEQGDSPFTNGYDYVAAANFAVSVAGGSWTDIDNTVGAMNISYVDNDGNIILAQTMGNKNVPEPGTMLMVGSSLFLLAGFGGRRFRKKK